MIIWEKEDSKIERDKCWEYPVREYCTGKEWMVIIYAKAIFSYFHKKDVDAFLSWIIIVLLQRCYVKKNITYGNKNILL